MRKRSINRRHGLFALLMAATFVGASVFSITSCQKEATTPLDNSKTIGGNDQKVTDHIRAFKNKMEYYRDNPQLKGGSETYSAEEASIELESLLNYDFCYTNVDCNVKTYSVSQIIMPLDDLKRINDPALMQVYYDRVIDTIQAQMLRVNYTNMKLLLVDLELDGYDSNGDATINIGSLVGNEYPVVLHDDNWWYGENLGICGTFNNAPEDAASQLQKRIKDELIPSTSSNCRWIYTQISNSGVLIPANYQLDPAPDNYLDYKIFYATEAVGSLTNEVKCMSQYEMSFYKGHYVDLAEDFEIQTSKDFADCEIDGRSYGPVGAKYIQHDYRIHVGNRILECDFTIGDILAVE